MLKAVLMDIDDTLLDFGKCAEQAMRIERGEGYFSAADKQRAAYRRGQQADAQIGDHHDAKMDRVHA